MTVYMALQPTSLHSYPGHPEYWWALTPPFHPYPAKDGTVIFCCNLYPFGHLPFRKCGALCCPDFPYRRGGTMERPTVFYYGTNSTQISNDSSSELLFQINKCSAIAILFKRSILVIKLRIISVKR